MNKTLNNLNIPAGYRILRPGSKIVKGDKFNYKNRQSYHWSDHWSDCYTSIGSIYCKGAREIDSDMWVVITARPKRIRKTNANANVKTENNSVKLENINDIVVGQKYSHTNYPGTVYLGCDVINPIGIRLNQKFLVIIKGECVGHKVVVQTLLDGFRQID